MEIIESDVVIIGGGPAGCTCALYTSRSNLKTVILDKNPSVGALAITHQIANYPGVPVDISGEKLLTLMREQAVQYGTDYRRAQVHPAGPPPIITTSDSMISNFKNSFFGSS